MIFEHFALNVREPHKVKKWYVDHLDLKVVSEMTDPPHMIFLADDSDRVVCELYHNSDAPFIDFAAQHHLTFHIAFESISASSDRDRLLRAGCTLVEEVKKEDGSLLVMLRDPWGLALQICQRGERMNSVALK